MLAGKTALKAEVRDARMGMGEWDPHPEASILGTMLKLL